MWKAINFHAINMMVLRVPKLIEVACTIALLLCLSTRNAVAGKASDHFAAAAVRPEIYIPDDDVNKLHYYYYNENTAQDLPPPCLEGENELIYANGMFSAAASFMRCYGNVPDASMISVFWNGSYHGQMKVYTSVVMNNLVLISEVESSVQMTFDLVMIWKDDRFAMPAFWDHVPMGFVDITATVLEDDNVELWRPEPFFPDAMSVEVLSEDYRLNSNNQFYYQASFFMTLIQPEFDFARYPGDSQSILIRFSDAEYSTRELVFEPTAIYFTSTEEGSTSFAENPIWAYSDSTYYSYIDDVYDNSYNIYQINVNRRAYGVVIRLILPMALLILLGSITFWVSYENRVDVTITILLSMSALYIVILNNIPLVGYLTNVDRFVFWMYFMLVLMTMLHQLYATLMEKLDRWPLRLLYLRLIEVTGRVFTLPAVIIYFAVYIPVSDDPAAPTLLIVFSCFAGAIVFVRESFGIRSSVYDAMRNLTEKVNKPDILVKQLSWVEALAMNLFYFQTLSSSKLLVSKHLQTNGPFPVKVRQPLHLKNLSSYMTLLEGTSGPKSGRRKSATVGAFHLSKVLSSSSRQQQQQNANDDQTSAAGGKNVESSEDATRALWQRHRRTSGLQKTLTSLLDPRGEDHAYTEDDFRLVQDLAQTQSESPTRSSSEPRRRRPQQSEDSDDEAGA